MQDFDTFSLNFKGWVIAAIFSAVAVLLLSLYQNSAWVLEDWKFYCTGHAIGTPDYARCMGNYEYMAIRATNYIYWSLAVALLLTVLYFAIPRLLKR